MHTKLESLTENLPNISIIDQLLFEKICSELDLEFKTENGDPSSYFTNQRCFLLTNKKFVCTFKFELYYLQKLANFVTLRPQVILSLLRRAAENFLINCQTRLKESQDFLKSFCDYFYTAIFSLAKICVEKENFKGTEAIYDYAFEFFSRQHKLRYQFDLVATILLAQADLHIMMEEKKKAIDIYSYILQILYDRLFENLESKHEADFNLLTTTLKKIRDTIANEDSAYFEICNSLAENRYEQTLAKLNLLAIKSMSNKNYLLSFNLFHIGNIFLILHKYNLDRETMQNPSEIDFKQTLERLHHATCLAEAIKKNDTERAIALIANHISLYEPDDNGYFPLHLAVKLKQLSVVRALLAENVPVEGMSQVFPPLLIAIQNKDFPMIQFFVEQGANLRLLVRGKSLLYFAYNEGEKKIVEYLIKNGAKLAKGEENLLKKNQLFQDFNNKILDEDMWKKILTQFNPMATKKIAIYCIPPVTGETSKYQHFADEIIKIDPDRPVIGMNSPVFFGKEPLSSVDEQADLYVKILKHLQPFGGPFILCGWSFGGLIAFEMARKLQKKNLEVKMLALFDTVSPSTLKTMSNQLYAKALHIYLNPCIVAFKLKDCLPPKEVLETCTREIQVELCTTAIQNEIQNMARRMKVQKKEGYNENLFLRILGQVKINLHAALQYEPLMDNCVRMVTCFNTTMSLELHPDINNNNNNDDDLGWSLHAKHCFTFKKDTTHVGLMDKPVVEQLASFVAQHDQLAQADSEYYMFFHAMHLQHYRNLFYVHEGANKKGHARNLLIFADENLTNANDSSKGSNSTFTPRLFKAPRQNTQQGNSNDNTKIERSEFTKEF